MLHGKKIREKNGGQYPLTVLVSAESGKGQGKSGAGNMRMINVLSIFEPRNSTFDGSKVVIQIF